MNYADDGDTVTEDTVTFKGPKPKKRRKLNGEYTYIMYIVRSRYPIFKMLSMSYFRHFAKGCEQKYQFLCMFAASSV